jgi:putative endonuclease
MKLYSVYILKCSDGTYYTGITNDIDRRLYEHQTELTLPVTLIKEEL